MPPKKLVTTLHPLWAYPDGNVPLSTVTFEIEPQGAVCKLSLTREDLEAEIPLTQGMIGGWAQVLSRLKTLLETGEPMMAAPISNPLFCDADIVGDSGKGHDIFVSAFS